MIEKQFNVAIRKTDAAKQTATGVVFSPNRIDSQGDFMTPEGIEAAAERFMKSGRTTSIDTNHNGLPVNAFVAESFISKVGSAFPADSWVITAKIEDPDTWQMVKSGKLTGFSMEGSGNRTLTKLKGKEARLLSNVEVFSISLVDKPANRTKFAVVKNDASKSDFKKALANLVNACNKATAATSGTPGPVSKAQDEEQVRKQQRAEQLHRQIEHDERTIQGLWEHPLPGWERREQRLTDRIEDAQSELAGLGVDDGDNFEQHSAFLGESFTMTADMEYLQSNTMGVVGDYPTVSKAEAAQPLDHNPLGITENVDESVIDLNGMKI